MKFVLFNQKSVLSDVCMYCQRYLKNKISSMYVSFVFVPFEYFSMFFFSLNVCMNIVHISISMYCVMTFCFPFENRLMVFLSFCLLQLYDNIHSFCFRMMSLSFYGCLFLYIVVFLNFVCAFFLMLFLCLLDLFSYFCVLLIIFVALIEFVMLI